MLKPEVISGMEEGHDNAGQGIGRLSMSPFECVAVRAGQGQILEDGLAAGASRDDMIDRKSSDLPASR